MDQTDIHVVLADHHEIVRKGLRRLLDDLPGLTIVGEAAQAEDTVDLVRRLKPDAVLMDAFLPGMGALEAARRIRLCSRLTRIVVVTPVATDPFPTQLLDAGAAGYLTRHCSVDEIADAIRAVHGGDRYISADIARQMALSMLPGREPSPFHRLSQREMQVMLMVTKGQSVRDISECLCLSPKTVSTYRYRLFDKLGVGNDVELTHLAIRHGVLELAAIAE
jgi:two-component system invasion response regulator UvrY